MTLDERLELLQQLDDESLLTNTENRSLDGIVIPWFAGDLSPIAPHSIISPNAIRGVRQRIAEPDAVGLEQRLLTAAMAGYYSYEWYSGLWELAPLFDQP